MKHDIWATSETAGLDDAAGAPVRSPLLDAKVMMVDDEPLMTDLIQTHLEEEGYANFVVTNDPSQAMELLRREEPGLLLLDLMMPRVSGFDLLEQIRADRVLRYTPVIVLTAATGGDTKLRALRLGATDFLSKPVDASELVLRVRNTLAFRQYHSRLIHFDPVTNLPNQRLFDRGLDEILARRALVGGMVALCSIIVPECRQLRESIDQKTADALARVLARRLDRLASRAGSMSPQATSTERAPRVARLGGDQFAIVLEGLPGVEEVEAAAKEVLARVSEPVVLGAREVVPGPWIGIAVAPSDGQTTEVLRRAADLAATHAREQAAAPIKFSSSELNAKSYERLTLGSQLRGAAQRGELRLHYQPKVDVVSNRILGVEALVRWQHPDHGLLAPGRFIALAEEMGLIAGIGEWVMQRACRDAAAWAKAGLGELTVAINVAKPQFTTGDLCGSLRDAMRASDLPPHRVVVEVTESLLMDDMPVALTLLHELKTLGVSISIDDFGTGYSSLSYLKRFPIDELKIDRSFLVDLPAHRDVAIVRTVIDLGHSLGMTVTAEGVERETQLACLRRLGCDHYQGFLFGRPVPAEEFVAMLASNRQRAITAPATAN